MGRIVKWLHREATENEEEGLMNASASADGGEEAKESWSWYDEKNADINCLLEADCEDRRAERTALAGDRKRETPGSRNRNSIDWPLDPLVSAPLPVTSYMSTAPSLTFYLHAAFASTLLYRLFTFVLFSTLPFFLCRPLFTTFQFFKGLCLSKFFFLTTLLQRQHTSSHLAFLNTTNTTQLVFAGH
jgi:hypothetical protein